MRLAPGFGFGTNPAYILPGPSFWFESLRRPAANARTVSHGHHDGPLQAVPHGRDMAPGSPTIGARWPRTPPSRPSRDPSDRHPLDVLGELHPVEPSVQPGRRQQPVLRAELAQPALVEQGDPVGSADRREAVRDDNGGPS